MLIQTVYKWEGDVFHRMNQLNRGQGQGCSENICGRGYLGSTMLRQDLKGATRLL